MSGGEVGADHPVTTLRTHDGDIVDLVVPIPVRVGTEYRDLPVKLSALSATFSHLLPYLASVLSISVALAGEARGGRVPDALRTPIEEIARASSEIERLLDYLSTEGRVPPEIAEVLKYADIGPRALSELLRSAASSGSVETPGVGVGG